MTSTICNSYFRPSFCVVQADTTSVSFAEYRRLIDLRQTTPVATTDYASESLPDQWRDGPLQVAGVASQSGGIR